MKQPERIDEIAKDNDGSINQGERVESQSGEPTSELPRRLPPGFAKGMITIVAEDEDHLKDFADYMP